MSGVVLRCPNCGTVQAAPGECEACHEAEVRHYCPNHAPGRWLDGPACPDCGARVGRPPPRAVPPPRPTPPPRPAPPPRAAPPPPSATSSGRGPRPREPRRPVPAPELEPTPVPEVGDAWPPVRRGPPVLWRIPGRSVARPAASLLGCVARLVGFAVLAFVLLAMATCWMLGGGGGGLGEWVVDVGQQVGVVEGVPEQTERGIAAFRAGDVARAERELEEAARSYPRSGVALLYLARIRLDAGDEPRARALLREAVRREPGNAVAHRELAGLHLTAARRARSAGESEITWRADLVEAWQHYAHALDLDPSDRRTRGYLGCTLVELGGPPGAAEKQLAEAGPGPWQACAAR